MLGLAQSNHSRRVAQRPARDDGDNRRRRPFGNRCGQRPAGVARLPNGRPETSECQALHRLRRSRAKRAERSAGGELVMAVVGVVLRSEELVHVLGSGVRHHEQRPQG